MQQLHCRVRNYNQHLYTCNFGCAAMNGYGSTHVATINSNITSFGVSNNIVGAIADPIIKFVN